MAFFVSFMAQALLITVGVVFVIWIGGMFKRTMALNPELIFIYFIVQALLSFSFVVMVSTLLP